VNPRRLYRSSNDRIIAGVCGGVAEYFDVDPAIVRVLWFVSTVFTGSLTFWAYVVMIFVVPEGPSEWRNQSPWAPGGAPIAPSVPAAADAPGAPTQAAAGPDAAPHGAADAGGPAGSAPTTADGPFGQGAGWGAAQGAGQGAGWSSDARSQWRDERRAMRAARHHDRTPGLVFGLILIALGGMLAWHQYDPHFDLGLAWPVAVAGLGLVLILSSVRTHESD